MKQNEVAESGFPWEQALGVSTEYLPKFPKKSRNREKEIGPFRWGGGGGGVFLRQ